MYGRIVGSIAGALLCSAVLAGAAPAATLTNAAGALTYTAAQGRTNVVGFGESNYDALAGTATVRVYRDISAGDDDPVAPTGCSPDPASDATVAIYVCAGVTTVKASAGDRADDLSANCCVDPAASGPRLIHVGAAFDLGAGDDTGVGGLAADDIAGGAGIDRVVYGSQRRSGASTVAVAVKVTLDDVADDGRAGEPADDVHGDVEDVEVLGAAGAPEGDATVTGSGAANSVETGGGNDTIDPAAGNDLVSSGDGDDTIRARDGYADRVTCGPGTDVAEADTFDVVYDSCENVRREGSAYATEDKPPTVGWTAPAPGATLSTTAVTTLTVNASDDNGVTTVLFLDDDRVVCTDTAAPYACDYRPTGGDVGRNTLVAVAIDTAQQTASNVRTVLVPRFAPTKFTSRTTPRSDRSGPRTFTTTGRLTLPTGVTPRQGCSGTVTVSFKAPKKTISTRRAKLAKTCTYRSKVRFHVRSRLSGRLHVVVRYGGNAVLGPASASRGAVAT